MPFALTLSITPSMGSGSAERRDHTVRRTGIRVDRRRGTRRRRSSWPSQISGSTGVGSTMFAPAPRSDSPCSSASSGQSTASALLRVVASARSRRSHSPATAGSMPPTTNMVAGRTRATSIAASTVVTMTRCTSERHNMVRPRSPLTSTGEITTTSVRSAGVGFSVAPEACIAIITAISFSVGDVTRGLVQQRAYRKASRKPSVTSPGNADV
jgi:hypothetical protein